MTLKKDASCWQQGDLESKASLGLNEPCATEMETGGSKTCSCVARVLRQWRK